MSTLTLSWHAYPIDGLALAIDVAGSDPPQVGRFGEIAFVQQATPAQLAVWSGKEASLSWWRGRFGGKSATLGPETAVTICGRAGVRQEVGVPEERATGAFRGSDGNIGHREHRVPPMIHVAVSGTTGAGVPFVASWIVEADRRDALHADEQHFFASIRCT